jgi:hypothetical protein
MKYLLLVVVFLSGCYVAPYKTMPEKPISSLLVEVHVSVPQEERASIKELIEKRIKRLRMTYVFLEDLEGESRFEKLNAMNADGIMLLKINRLGPSIEVYNVGVTRSDLTYGGFKYVGLPGFAPYMIEESFNDLINGGVFTPR